MTFVKLTCSHRGLENRSLESGERPPRKFDRPSRPGVPLSSNTVVGQLTRARAIVHLPVKPRCFLEDTVLPRELRRGSTRSASRAMNI